MTSTVPPTPPLPPVPPQDGISDASGRIELAPGAVPTDNRFVNEDLLPVSLERRRWTTYNFAALCIAQEKTRTLARGADLRVRGNARQAGDAGSGSSGFGLSPWAAVVASG
ncbi:hypothetical protein ACFWOJ_33295 [Streptomyces sp. NPDC058439]|uniref:hypothetical protein n=1 Tax=Streptomyces sp. NPDC058439 TaxID=3346500 RepID=UPI003662AA40